MSPQHRKGLWWKWPGIARRTVLKLAGATMLVPSLGRAAEQGANTAAAAELWPSPFAVKIVWGYAGKHSVVAGESFDVMLSTGPDHRHASGRLEFFRIGFHPEGGRKLVWTSAPVEVESRPVPRGAAATGAAWPATLRDIDTSGWPPGYYSAEFVHAETGVRDLQVLQVVVRNPRRDGRVLLKLSTNTYQAYNRWGGHSLYPTEEPSQRGNVVSFDRPTPPAFFEYEVYLARWLEALGREAGFMVDYATDFDVHSDPTLVTDYPLVLSGSHDEYWTKEAFDAFEQRIYRLGRNVIFFGADTAYFQVRYADLDRPHDGDHRGRQLVCYKSLDDPVARRRGATDPMLLVTARFRDGERRPESMLVGVAYQNWFPPDDDKVRFAYVVESTDAPFFTGTGYKPGDVAADVVGYEWDNRDPAGDGRRLWDRDRSKIAPLPAERIKVLFRGAPVGVDGKPGRAEAVYFESPAGAKVFSTGSIRWAWGLGKPGFEREPFKRFNANVVRYLLPAG